MALANSRPLSIPTVDTEIIANSNSPMFKASSLVHASTELPGSFLEADMKSKPKMEPKAKKTQGSFPTSNLQETISISKSIPVTGERPKPQSEQSPLNEDEVLYNIFVILWENDPTQQGMTVKQLCDLLVEKHPEISNLSTKLSNLISAKLNAYVKKVEKGEKGLLYALSREWSDASPRRMVYVYRGILAPDYEEHAHAAAAAAAASSNFLDGNGFNKTKSKSKKQLNKNGNDSTSDATSLTADGKEGSSNRPPSISLVKSSTFSAGNFASDFNIPYMSSPVSVSLTPKINDPHLPQQTEFDLEQQIPQTGKRASTQLEKPIKKQKMETSKSVSQSEQTDQQPVYVTIAGLTPRLSKSPTRVNSTGQIVSSNVAQMVADIHKTVVTQNPIEILSRSSSSLASCHENILGCEFGDKDTKCQWLRSLRDGFLLEDIATPESLSPDDFDEFFA